MALHVPVALSLPSPVKFLHGWPTDKQQKGRERGVPCPWKPELAYWVKNSALMAGFVLAEGGESHALDSQSWRFRLKSSALVKGLIRPGLDSPGQSHGDDLQVPGRPKAVPGATRQIRRPSKFRPFDRGSPGTFDDLKAIFGDKITRSRLSFEILTLVRADPAYARPLPGEPRPRPRSSKFCTLPGYTRQILRACPSLHQTRCLLGEFHLI